MSADEIKALTAQEKLQIMEVIWEEFRERFEAIEVSESEKRMLDERRARATNGTCRLLEWDVVKDSLGKQ